MSMLPQIDAISTHESVFNLRRFHSIMGNHARDLWVVGSDGVAFWGTHTPQIRWMGGVRTK